MAHVVLRAGRRCRDAYEQIKDSIHNSSWVVADETGWKVSGRPAWLHALVGPAATCYCVSEKRGGEVPAAVLDWDWSGVLVHDGLASYDRFRNARHQQCLGHVLRRARQMAAVAQGGAVHFPRAVTSVLEEALSLRDLHRARRISSDTMTEGTLALACRLEELTSRPKHSATNERLRKHLQNHLWDWFRFLLEPGVDATNWRAEHAVRLGVINRKEWGGNRGESGRRAQEVLMSVIATCLRQHRCPIEFICLTLCGWMPQLIIPP